MTPSHKPGANANRGSNQTAVRSYNERLILHLVRRHKSLTKADIAQATGLSPNAVSVIIRSLEDAGLLLREAPIRGRVGQPSTPVRLNPDARYYLGLKIGRHSADLVLIDYVGTPRAVRSMRYALPEPESVRAFLQDKLRQVLREARLPHGAIAGFGIAMPFEIWHWTDDIGAPRGALDVWRGLDLATLLPRGARWPVTITNDATAACVAETTFARSDDIQDAIYLFVGTLIGGGVILNGGVFFGRTGNAGGFGPFRVPGGPPGAERLIDHASLVVLERMLREAGRDPAAIYDTPDEWTVPQEIVERWLEIAAHGLSHAIASSLALIDFEMVIIDGSIPPSVRDDLVDRVRSIFLTMDLQGLHTPAFSSGRYGGLARAIGAAAVPLNGAHSINQNSLMR